MPCIPLICWLILLHSRTRTPIRRCEASPYPLYCVQLSSPLNRSIVCLPMRHTAMKYSSTSLSRLSSVLHRQAVGLRLASYEAPEQAEPSSSEHYVPWRKRRRQLGQLTCLGSVFLSCQVRFGVESIRRGLGRAVTLPCDESVKGEASARFVLSFAIPNLRTNYLHFQVVSERPASSSHHRQREHYGESAGCKDYCPLVSHPAAQPHISPAPFNTTPPSNATQKSGINSIRVFSSAFVLIHQPG